MTLIINNRDVEEVLTMDVVVAALEESYFNLAKGEAVCRPRIDIRIPTSDPTRNYQFGSMEGGSTGGYFATRMKSDIIYEAEYNGVVTQDDTTASMIKSSADLIAYVSTFMTLKPGDIIATGTPVKLGPKSETPKWLVPGDVIEIEVPEIGVLRNSVVMES